MELVVDGIIYQFQPKGGVSRVFSEVMPRICELDESLHILLLTSGPCKQPLPTHSRIHHRPTIPIELFLRPSRLWGPIVPLAKGMVQRLYIGNAKGRIWHSTYYTMPYQLGKASWNGPHVVTVVDMIFEKFPEYFSNAAQAIETKKRCIEKADRVIAISNSTKRDILEYFNMPEDRVSVTYLAASPMFRPLPEPEKREFKSRMGLIKPFMLYVGHRGGYKNFQMLLETYSLWKRKGVFDLICVGGAGKWSRDENELIRRAISGDSVRLFPNAADEELRGFYSCAYAFVYPSLYEGFGIPPLEAMACGTPVIVSNTSSIPEVVGDAGLYFEPSSKEELLAVLDRVTEDEDLQQELIKRGLERSKIFNWHETAIKTYNVYREVS